MKKRVIASAVLACVSANVWGLNISADAGIALEHSDNIRKANTNEESDTERIVTVGFGLNHEGDRIQSQIDYSISRSDYQQNTYGGETSVNGSALVNLELVENSLNWKIANQTNESQVNSRGEDTEDNRTNRNMFSTGPELIVPIGQVDRITAQALYQDISFDGEVDTSDNQRLNGSLEWGHFLAGEKQIYVGFAKDDVDFEERSNNDYKKDRYYIGFSSQEGYLTYDFSIGREKIKMNYGDNIDGNFRQISISYLKSEHRFIFTHNNQLSDSTVGLSLYDVFNNQGVDLGSAPIYDEFGQEIEWGDINFDLAQVVERTRNQFTYISPNYNGLQFYASLYKDEQDYKGRLEDEKSTGGDLTLSYKIVESTSLEASYRQQTTTFKDEPLLGKDKEKGFRIGLVHDITDSLSASAWFLHEEQKNSVNDTREYKENIVSVGIRYSFN